MSDILDKKLDVVISLLARMAFAEGRIRQIVTKGKRDPKGYVRGYNSCDGKRRVTELAGVVGVKPATVSPILKAWEEAGIVYDVGEPARPMYMRLLELKE